jgi:hypothetical protein
MADFYSIHDCVCGEIGRGRGMTCQPAISAVMTPQPNGDDRAFFRSCRNTSGAGSDTALIIRVTQKLKSQPPLELTALHQREALILDRNRAAKMLDMQSVHRLERDLRKLTNRILAKGVCSDG